MLGDDRGQSAPTLIFLVIAIGMAWQFVYAGAELPSFEPDEQIDGPGDEEDEGFMDILFGESVGDFFDGVGGVFTAIWGAIKLFASLLTFSVVEGPSQGPGVVVWEVIKWGWRVVVGGSLLWAILLVIRG